MDSEELISANDIWQNQDQGVIGIPTEKEIENPTAIHHEGMCIYKLL